MNHLIRIMHALEKSYCKKKKEMRCFMKIFEQTKVIVVVV